MLRAVYLWGGTELSLVITALLCAYATVPRKSSSIYVLKNNLIVPQELCISYPEIAR